MTLDTFKQWLVLESTVYGLKFLKYNTVRKAVKMLAILWGRLKGRAALIKLVASIIGLTFKQFMFTDQQLGDGLGAALMLHEYEQGTSTELPTFPMPEADWEAFSTGLKLLGDEIGVLFSLPDNMVWEMFGAASGEFLGRVPPST